jgi:hypothetical protein
MKALLSDFFAGLLEGGTERRDLKFKPAFNWRSEDSADLWVRESVTRAIIGMHNTRGGGVIVVGIEQEKPDRRMKVVGVNETESPNGGQS